MPTIWPAFSPWRDASWRSSSSRGSPHRLRACEHLPLLRPWSPRGVAARVALGVVWPSAALHLLLVARDGAVGEFSFVCAVARAGHISQDVYQTTLAASLITILLNAALPLMESWWAGSAGRPTPSKELAVERRGLRDHVVLCGFGAWGRHRRALESFASVSVIELDRRDKTAARGVHASSATRAWPLLSTRGRSRALAVVTVPEADRARLAVQVFVACARPAILARFHDAASRDGLLRAGGRAHPAETEARRR